MPRKARMFLPGVPCHVISRGNNRRVCFYAEADYRLYIDCLADACRRYDVALHAYVLMSNHVHLLMTPASTDAVSRVMQSLGRRYVQYVNNTYQQTGTLWEGRFKCSLIDAEGYLLACHRYIELNPVRAGMVNHPADYQWSSYRVNAGYKNRRQLVPHPVYLALSDHETIRLIKYRDLFTRELDSETVNAIQRAAAFSMPAGSSRFIEEVEAALGRKIGQACRGRPRARDR